MNAQEIREGLLSLDADLSGKIQDLNRRILANPQLDLAIEQRIVLTKQRDAVRGALAIVGEQG